MILKRAVFGCPIPTLCQVGEVPTGGASGLPPLKLAEAGQLVQSLVSVYQKAGTNSIPSVGDESAISVSRLASNLVNAKNRSWLGGPLCVRGFW